MCHSIPVECEMRTTLPASLRSLEGFYAAFRLRSQPLLDAVKCFSAELLVREALTNAVVHGCHCDPSKQVRCSVRFKRGRLLIVIQDEGEGFDWRTARLNSAGIADSSGRGIEILRKYANRVRYNDKGNLVTIIKRF